MNELILSLSGDTLGNSASVPVERAEALDTLKETACQRLAQARLSVSAFLNQALHDTLREIAAGLKRYDPACCPRRSPS